MLFDQFIRGSKSNYFSMINDANTVAVSGMFVTSAKQDEELIYGITKALWSKTARKLLDNGHAKVKASSNSKSTLFFAIICLFAGIVTAVSSELYVMLAGRFLLGIGAEPLIVAVTTALAKWFKGKNQNLKAKFNYN